MTVEQRKCFIIMPISETVKPHTEAYWKQHYELLKQIIEEIENLEAHRSAPLREDILRAIIADLITADVVVADLTDYNANVFWELGVRQSFKHCTVTIAQEGTHLPFDQMAKATLFYETTTNVQWEDFRKRLKAAVNDCLENPEKPDSPVLENITGRGTLFELFHRDETIRRMDALEAEIESDLNVLNHVLQIARKNQKLEAGKYEYATSRLLFSSIELLITERYLREEPEFYEGTSVCFEKCMTVNDQLSLWEHSPILTNQWILDTFDKDKAREQQRTTPQDDFTWLQKRLASSKERIIRQI